MGMTQNANESATESPSPKAPADMVPRDAQGNAISPNHDRIRDLRSRLSGWHFSQEMLTKDEREILYVAEQVMATLDELCGGYLR
jgi:hypothetical protein